MIYTECPTNIVPTGSSIFDLKGPAENFNSLYLAKATFRTRVKYKCDKKQTYFGLLGVLFLAELFDDTRSFGSEFSLSFIGDFLGDITF